jgi:SAM-dependent MidA family methyltransferase
MMDRTARLRALIEEEIRRSGPISFERFMERALYEPGLGYYCAAGGEARGPGVDFRTSPLAGRVFALLVASQIEQCRDLLGAPEDFALVEFGAGSGALARGILASLQARGRWPARGRYLMVDPHAEAAARTVAQAAEPAGAVGPAPRFAGEDEGLRALGEGPAFVLSNEYLDALPVRRFVVRDGRMREIRVGCGPSPDALVEIEAEVEGPETLPVPPPPAGLPEGFQFEDHRRAREWMERVGGALQRGFVLTLDYGYRRAERFRPERAAGTCLAYERHRVERDLLSRPGEKDLTSHVDFDELIEAGARHGLEALGLTDQMRFLTALAAPLGILEGEPASPAQWRERLAFKELIRPGGMGTAFSALAQAKGVASHPPLRGLVDPFAH